VRLRRPWPEGFGPTLALILAAWGALALVVILAGCAPRIVDAPGLAAAVDRLGYYDDHANVIVLDLPALAATEALYPGARAWVEAHERGHWRLNGSGIALGPGVVGLERLAQCWAEHLTGTGPPFPMPAEDGYWDCPPWALALVEAAT